MKTNEFIFKVGELITNTVIFRRDCIIPKSAYVMSLSPSFVLSAFLCVCLSALPHVTVRLSLNWFRWSLTVGLLRKCVEEVQIYLQSDKNIRYFTWRPKYVLTLLPTWIHHEGICATLVTVIFLVRWTHLSVTLYAHCLSCLCMSVPVNYVQTTQLHLFWLHNLYRDVVCRVPFKTESD